MRVVCPENLTINEGPRNPIRRIAILSAMPSELKLVRRSLGITSRPHEGEGYCTATYKGVTVITAVTKMGLGAAQAASEELFARYGSTIDHVFVVGRVAAYDLRLKVGEVVVPEAVVDQRDGIARYPVNLSTREPSGVVYSSDQCSYDYGYIAELNNNNVSVVDMDSGAISGVCHRFGCPITIVRAVSDQMDLLVEPRDVFDLENLPDYRAAIQFALRRPRRIGYLIALALGVNKAIAASSKELLRNIESLLQQDGQMDSTLSAAITINTRP